MANVQYIPTGTKNLRTYFPLINWDLMSEFFIEVLNPLNAVIATTTLQQIGGCDEQDQRVRLHFLNYPGSIDAENFVKVAVEQDTKSVSYEKADSFPLVKSQHGISRNAVSSNDLYTVTKSIPEERMQYFEEMLNSSVAYMEWIGTEGQADDYIPIVIIDSKSVKFQQEDRFYYAITLQFTLSHERQTIRN